jgi:FkbM family methyltransferase
MHKLVDPPVTPSQPGTVQIPQVEGLAAPVHQVAQCLLPGDLVFDVGSNVGDKAAALLARGVKVVCVEPQPACVAILERRFAGHPDVKIVPKGLGSRPGILEMHINTQAPVLSTFSPEWMTGRFAHETWDQKVDVAITTLDDLVREHGTPRYVKIDVEGFEYEVVCGLTRRVGVVSFEFTSEFFANAERMLRYLQNLGYSRFNFSVGERTDFALANWADVAPLCAVLKNLAVRYEKLWGDIYAN